MHSTNRAQARTMRSAARVLLGVIAMISTISCTRSGDIDVTTAGGRRRLFKSETLRLVITAEPPSLDFQKSSDSASTEILTNLMDGLVDYDFFEAEPRLKPALAISWRAEDHARKWIFTLRPGVIWTDGVAFSAQQVVDGWRRLLTPATAAQYAYFLFNIRNAKAFNSNKIKSFSEVGVRATGPLEIEVQLERPIAFFPYLLTHHSTLPVRADLIAKYGEHWTEPGKLETLGPYKLISWQHDKLLAMERSDNYWGAKPFIKYIVEHVIPEASTALNLFEGDQVDALNAVPSSDLRALSKLKQFRSIESTITGFYGMNVAKPPLEKPEMRRAIVQAIDRRQIVAVLAGGQTPTSSVLPIMLFGYDPDIGLKFNPAEARRSMAKAGFSDPSKVPRLTIKTNANEDHQKVAENIQAQLRVNLGIAVEILPEDWKVFLVGLRTDPPNLFRWGWLGDYPDPDNFLNLMTSYSENNHMRWKNVRYDRLIDEGAGEVDQAKRRAIYKEAQLILTVDDPPVIPLYSVKTFYLIGDRVDGDPVNPMRRTRLNETRLKASP